MLMPKLRQIQRVLKSSLSHKIEFPDLSFKTLIIFSIKDTIDGRFENKGNKLSFSPKDSIILIYLSRTLPSFKYFL